MRLDLARIAWLAREVGFHQTQSGLAAAVAYATSHGHTHYHRVIGLVSTGDQRGLWGVDVDRYPAFADDDLYGPEANARAALALTRSHDGFGWSPVYEAGIPRHLLDRAATAATYDNPRQTFDDVTGAPELIGRMERYRSEMGYLRARLTQAQRWRPH